MSFLFINILFLLHPFYVSTTEISINKDMSEVKIKIFRDDLEDGLRLFHGNSISIDSDRKLEIASDEIDEYIKNKFQLSIDNYDIDMSMIRYKLINDLVEISFYFNYEEEINEINIMINILESLISAVLGFLIIFLIMQFGAFIFKKPAMGLGDAKLASMIGFWIGFPGVIISIWSSFIIAGLFIILGFASKKIKKGQLIPFGPFLSLTGFLIWLYGENIFLKIIF